MLAGRPEKCLSDGSDISGARLARSQEVKLMQENPSAPCGQAVDSMAHSASLEAR